MTDSISDRVISLGPNLATIPERLLLSHAKGQVLFIVGAGVSKSSGMPDFRDLVVKVYQQIDSAVHSKISSISRDTRELLPEHLDGLTHQQAAEARRFVAGDYDVCLGMLERRIEGRSAGDSIVRKAIVDRLRLDGVYPAQIHRAIMRLSDRGGSISVVTTNFEHLLEAAVPRSNGSVQSYSLGGIPRPGRGTDFAGVFHIHGALDKNPLRSSDLVVTDRDFGEFYLRRRVVPDFIYDAARLYNLVLVGYSANDPPMRYLLNAVAADGSRFDDLKERFSFIGSDELDPINLEDWNARGITPIYYNSAGEHEVLLHTFMRWADLSPINGRDGAVDALIRRIVKTPRRKADDSERDLFDHLIRRSDNNERNRLSAHASECGADLEWLEAIAAVCTEYAAGGSK